MFDKAMQRLLRDISNLPRGERLFLLGKALARQGVPDCCEECRGTQCQGFNEFGGIFEERFCDNVGTIPVFTIHETYATWLVPDLGRPRPVNPYEGPGFFEDSLVCERCLSDPDWRVPAGYVNIWTQDMCQWLMDVGTMIHTPDERTLGLHDRWLVVTERGVEIALSSLRFDENGDVLEDQELMSGMYPGEIFLRVPLELIPELQERSGRSADEAEEKNKPEEPEDDSDVFENWREERDLYALARHHVPGEGY